MRHATPCLRHRKRSDRRSFGGTMHHRAPLPQRAGESCSRSQRTAPRPLRTVTKHQRRKEAAQCPLGRRQPRHSRRQRRRRSAPRSIRAHRRSLLISRRTRTHAPRPTSARRQALDHYGNIRHSVVALLEVGAHTGTFFCCTSAAVPRLPTFCFVHKPW